MTEFELRQQMKEAVVQLLANKIAKAEWNEDAFDNLAQDFVSIAINFGHSRFDEGLDVRMP